MFSLFSSAFPPPSSSFTTNQHELPSPQHQRPSRAAPTSSSSSPFDLNHLRRVRQEVIPFIFNGYKPKSNVERIFQFKIAHRYDSLARRTHEDVPQQQDEGDKNAGSPPSTVERGMKTGERTSSSSSGVKRARAWVWMDRTGRTFLEVAASMKHEPALVRYRLYALLNGFLDAWESLPRAYRDDFEAFSGAGVRVAAARGGEEKDEARTDNKRVRSCEEGEA